MTFVSGTPTINRTSTLMIKVALQQRLKNKGTSNPRIDFALQGVIRCPADEELIDVCYSLMQEIDAVRASHAGASWRWEHPVPAYQVIPQEYTTICEIIGCWLGDDCLYVNQSHEDWR